MVNITYSMHKFKYVFGGIIVSTVLLIYCIVSFSSSIPASYSEKLDNESYSSIENALLYLNESMSNTVVREQLGNKELFIIYNDYIRFIVLKNDSDGIAIEKYSEKLSELNWTYNTQPFTANFEVDNKIITVIIQNRKDLDLNEKDYITLSNEHIMFYHIE